MIYFTPSIKNGMVANFGVVYEKMVHGNATIDGQ